MKRSWQLIVGSLLWVSFLPGSMADGKECQLKVMLTVNQRAYHIGDTFRCSIRLTNVGSKPIRLLAEDVWVEAADLRFEATSTGKTGTVVRLSDVFDVEGYAKDVVVLDPKRSVERTLTAKILRELPPTYHERQHGLVLNFTGSALVLPGFGRYTVTKTFRQFSDGVVSAYLKPGPPFCDAVAVSSPVNVEFVQK